MDEDLFAFIRVRPIKRRVQLGQASRHAARRDTVCSTPPEEGGNRRPGYDPEKRALGWAWTQGKGPPDFAWISETNALDADGNRLPVPQPCDYVGAYDHRVASAGAKQRKGSPLAFHIQAGVSPAWIEEKGGLHDIDGAAWTERTGRLIQGATAWGQQQFGAEAVVAARYDRDEIGGGVVDLVVVPVHDSTPGLATTPHPIVSTNKELERLGGGRGKGHLAFSALQDSWAAYVQQHLDPRIQRGVSAEETGRTNIAPAAYRRQMARLEEERREKEAEIERAETALAEMELSLENAQSQVRRMRRQIDSYVAWVQEWAEFVDEFSEQIADLDVRAMPARFPPEIPGLDDADGADDADGGPEQTA